jgi:hypothetical protein
MIDVKQAVSAASEYLSQLYPSAKLHDVFLEEVALSDDERHWYVTIGFARPIPSPNATLAAMDAAMGRQNYERVYKLFEIDSDTGQVRSMKIRAA